MRTVIRLGVAAFREVTDCFGSISEKASSASMSVGPIKAIRRAPSPLNGEGRGEA